MRQKIRQKNSGIKTNSFDWELLTFDNIKKIVLFGILIHVLYWKQKCLEILVCVCYDYWDFLMNFLTCFLTPLYDAVQNPSFCYHKQFINLSWNAGGIKITRIISPNCGGLRRQGCQRSCLRREIGAWRWQKRSFVISQPNKGSANFSAQQRL